MFLIQEFECLAKLARHQPKVDTEKLRQASSVEDALSISLAAVEEG
jgi:hypothetical protein